MKTADQKLLKSTRFNFTEPSIKALCKAAEAGEFERGEWSDSGSNVGLRLRIGPRGGVFYSERRVNGKKRNKRLGPFSTTTVRRAREEATRIAAGLEGGSSPIRGVGASVSAQEVFDSYIVAAKAGTFGVGRKRLRESTAKSYVQLWRPHIEDRFGGRSLSHLAAEIPDIHRDLNNKPATQKRLLQLLKNVYEHAFCEGLWSLPNPTLDPATGKPLRCQSVPDRERYLTEPELCRLFRWVERQTDPWKDYFSLLLLTGQRKATVSGMAWSDIDVEEATWRLGEEKTKNGRPLVVQLQPEAVEILRDRRQRIDATAKWVFPSNRKSGSGHLETVDHAFKRMCSDTGLVDLRIHDIRRTAGTIAAKDHSLPEVMQFLGHRTVKAALVYARATQDGARRAGASVSTAYREALGHN